MVLAGWAKLVDGGELIVDGGAGRLGEDSYGSRRAYPNGLAVVVAVDVFELANGLLLVDVPRTDGGTGKAKKDLDRGGHGGGNEGNDGLQTANEVSRNAVDALFTVEASRGAGAATVQTSGRGRRKRP